MWWFESTPGRYIHSTSNMSSDLQSALQNASVSLARGDLDGARTACEAVLESDPGQPGALHMLGFVYLKTGDAARGAELIRQSLAAQPQNFHGLLHLGNALKALDQVEEAVVSYRKAVELSPGLAEAHNNLGNALRQLGHEPEARAAFEQGLAAEPDNFLLLYNLARHFLHERDWSSARKLLDRVVQLNTGLTSAWLDLSRCATYQGDLTAAQTACEKACELEPASALSHFELGNVRQAQGNPQEAVSSYEKATELDSGFAAAYVNLGNALRDTGRTDPAIKAIETAIRLEPANKVPYLNLGNLLFDCQRNEAAVEAYRQAVELDPEFFDAWNNLATVYLELGRNEAAIEGFERARRIEPDNNAVGHMLNALKGKTSTTAPPEYVRALFDQYSGNFEKHLVEKLEYRIPTLLRGIIDEHCSGVHFGAALDLGCGSGLSGTSIRDICDVLIGVDLSPGILAKAKEKGLYDELHAAELVEYLQSIDRQFDLVVACDVLVYVGDLEPLFAAVRERMARGALLGFSTEVDPDKDYVLRETGRFAHSSGYISGLAEKHGLEIISREDCVVRKDWRGDMTGEVYVLKA